MIRLCIDLILQSIQIKRLSQSKVKYLLLAILINLSELKF